MQDIFLLLSKSTTVSLVSSNDIQDLKTTPQAATQHHTASSAKVADHLHAVVAQQGTSSSSADLVHSETRNPHQLAFMSLWTTSFQCRRGPQGGRRPLNLPNKIWTGARSAGMRATCPSHSNRRRQTRSCIGVVSPKCARSVADEIFSSHR